MIIQDFIADIVSSLQIEGGNPPVVPTFIHGSDAWLNLKADEIQNDIVFLDEPIISIDAYRQSGLLEESYNLSMMFLTKSEFDFTPEQQKPLIARMRRLRLAFLNKLSKTSLRNTSFNVRTIDVVNVLNVNLTGVIVMLTITPIDPQPQC